MLLWHPFVHRKHDVRSWIGATSMRLIECLKRQSNDYSKLDRCFRQKTQHSIYQELAEPTTFELEVDSVSIIVPSFNSRDTLDILLDSIEGQHFDKSKLEVVIVDDGSTDNSHKLLEARLARCGVASTLLRHRKNLGRATARNSGAYLARNDVLLFLDSDVILPQHFVYNHAIKHTMVDYIVLSSMRERIGQSPVLYEKLREDQFRFRADKSSDWRYHAQLDDGTVISNVCDTDYWMDFGYYERYVSKTLAEMCISTAVSIRKARFFETGGFYQGFKKWGREDVFFAAMAMACGMFVVPELTTVYQIRRTTPEEEQAKKKDLATNMALYETLLEQNTEQLRHSNQIAFLAFGKRFISIERFGGDKRSAKASVIIPLYRDERIHQCLEALSVQSIDRENYEIIVVENGSHEFAEIAHRYGARYIHLSEASMPKARNKGLDEARFDVILFTDADCVPTYYWLEEMLKGLEKNRIVGGPISNLAENEGFLSQYSQPICHGQRKPNYLPILDLPYVAGANCGFYKADLLQVGGYDENLPSGNDVDICYKLGLAGIPLAIVSRAGVFHHERRTASGYFRRFYRYARYQSAIFAKYRSVSGKRFFVNRYPLAKFFRGGGDTIAGSVKGDKTRARTGLADLIEGAGLLAGYLHGMLEHRTVFVPW